MDIDTSHLRTRGKRLFNSVSEEFDLAAAEVETLLLAAETLDKIETLNEMCEKHGLIIESPQGKKTAPWAQEARALTVLYDKLIRSLDIPEADE